MTSPSAKPLPYAEVIGDPIRQSKSPLIHQFWLDKRGIAATYGLRHVYPEHLAEYVKSRRHDEKWRGCNVTIPHKIAIIPHLDIIDTYAEAIGAVNTVRRTPDGDLHGYNSDFWGFMEPLDDLKLDGQAVGIIGSGGAALAVMAAFAKWRVGHVHMFVRNADKGKALLQKFGLPGTVHAIGTPPPPMALVVNASSLGMAGQPPLDFDQSDLGPDCVAYDLVYAPLETEFLKAARLRGARTVDGLAMLIGQAAIAFERFFGDFPPRECDAELRQLLMK